MRTEPKKAGEYLIVVIGNSQAFGREVEDHETYAAVLAGSLAVKTGRRIRVVNWGIPGGCAPEFIVLGAAVSRLDPDVILLAVTPGNFRKNYARMDKETGRRKPWASDSHYLLAYRDVRRGVSGDFVRHLFGPLDYLEIGLGHIWRPWRYRHLPAAWLARFQTLSPLLKHQRKETWFFGESRLMNIRRRSSTTRIHWDFVDAYLDATSDTAPRRVVVSMPLHSRRQGENPGFMETVRLRFEAAGGEGWDLSAALPDKAFVSATHLNVEGHVRMAERLKEHLTR